MAFGDIMCSSTSLNARDNADLGSFYRISIDDSAKRGG